MRTPRLKRAVQGIATAALVLAATTAAAQSVLIQPTGQTRSISSSAFAQDLGGPLSDSNSDQAADFTPTMGLVSSIASLDGAEGTGGGIQDSEIRDDAIVASGSASATAESFDDDGVADGSGSSIVEVDFTLLTGASFTLQGEISAFDNGSAQLILRDSSGEIFREDASSDTIVLAEAGTLPAGQYTLEVNASGSASADFPFDAEFAFSEYDVTLQFSVAAVPAVGPMGLSALAILLAAIGRAASTPRH
jgi:hypothetical protein